MLGRKPRIGPLSKKAIQHNAVEAYVRAQLPTRPPIILSHDTKPAPSQFEQHKIATKEQIVGAHAYAWLKAHEGGSTGPLKVTGRGIKEKADSPAANPQNFPARALPAFFGIGRALGGFGKMVFDLVVRERITGPKQPRVDLWKILEQKDTPGKPTNPIKQSERDNPK